MGGAVQDGRGGAKLGVGGKSVAVTLRRRRVMVCEDDAWTWGEVVVRRHTTVRYEVCPVGCRVWARRIFLHASVRVVPCVPTHNYVRAEVTATGGTLCVVVARVGHFPAC